MQIAITRIQLQCEVKLVSLKAGSSESCTGKSAAKMNKREKRKI